MASGLNWVWLVTVVLWGAIVYKDMRRVPFDGRRFISLAAFLLIACASYNRLTEANLNFILLNALAVVVLIGWTLSNLGANRRRSRIADWGSSHGFEPVAIERKGSSESLPEGLRRLPFLGRGRAAWTEGVIARRDGDVDGEECRVFDHTIRRKVVWYDANGAEATGTVVALRRPGMWLPLFQVRPVGMFDWFDGGALGDAVPLKADSGFAKSYRLGGHEPRNLRSFFTDELLASIAEKPGWLIEGEGEWIAAFYFDRAASVMSLKSSTLRTVKVDQLDDHVRDASRLLGRIADRDARTATRGVGAA